MVLLQADSVCLVKQAMIIFHAHEYSVTCSSQPVTTEEDTCIFISSNNFQNLHYQTSSSYQIVYLLELFHTKGFLQQYGLLFREEW